MRRFLVALCLLGACSDQYLEQADEGYAGRRVGTLAEASEAARALSDRYVEAARNTRTVQDAASFLVFASAASVVTGAAGSATNAELARRAVTGAGAQQAGARLAPKTAVAGIYKGARRLNCVATVAAMGEALDLSEPQRQAALAATVGSIEHIRILTREALVREVADFNGLLGSFKDAAKSASEARARGFEPMSALSRSEPELVIDQYLQLLSTCTAEAGTTVPAGIPKRN